MPVSGQVFDVVPSLRRATTVRTVPADAELSKVDAVAIAVTSDRDIPAVSPGDAAELAPRFAVPPGTTAPKG